MTKFDIHDALGVVMILPPSEGNRELSDEEAAEYRENIEKVLAVFPAKDKACDGRQETNHPENTDRLTRRGAKGGITVMNMPAALNKLAQYEDAAERAEKIMPPEEVIHVLDLEYEHWRDYIPDEYQGELEAARSAVLAFMCCDEDSGYIREGGDPV